MRRSLELDGNYTILQAQSYNEALQVFQQFPSDVDLLVTDVSLPMRTGVDLARALLRAKPDLKVLFVSGWVGSEILRAFGFDKLQPFFLPKPFRAAVFLEKVHNVLASSELLRFQDEPPRRDKGGLTPGSGRTGK